MTLWDRAAALFQQGNLPEAEQACLQLLKQVPADFAANRLLGALRARQGRFEEALASYDTALAVQSDFALLYYRGVALRALKRSDEALACFDAALRHNPDSAEAWNARGNALNDLNHPPEALASFDRALAINPDLSEAQYNRAMSLNLLRRFDEALAAYNRALDLNPDFTQALNNRGNCLLALRRYPEALADYDRVLAANPDSVESWNNRGSALQSLQRFDEALACYDKALAIDPRNRDLLRNRAKMLCESHQAEEGFALFRHVAEAFPQPAQNPEPAHKIRHDEEQRAWLAAGNGVEAGARLAGPAILPHNNVEQISGLWKNAKPQIVVIDNFLTEEALEKLQRFCWSAPVWQTIYSSGYLGADPEQGFCCPLLAQIADEMRLAWPVVFGDHGLHYLWGFKYDSQMRGTGVHADEAAVNVNFWITPDQANLDPEGGGLVVWDAAAPLDWDFAKYNSDDIAIREFLERSGARSVTIPYRANRAVIFDSDLFHETDTIRFKDGYLNRRINVTLLYGRREWSDG